MLGGLRSLIIPSVYSMKQGLSLSFFCLFVFRNPVSKSPNPKNQENKNKIYTKESECFKCFQRTVNNFSSNRKVKRGQCYL